MLRFPLRALLTTLLCSFLLACGTTRLVDTWKSPEFNRDNLRNVLVVAATSNTTTRVIFESSFAAEMQKQGIQAIPSFQAIGDQAPTKEAVLDFVKQSKVDHVVAVKLGYVDIEVDQVPESVMTYYTGPYYAPNLGGYWGAWGGNTVTMTRESYIDTQTNVFLSTAVYDAKTEALTWGGRSKSFDVNAVSQVASELASQMMRQMRH